MTCPNKTRRCRRTDFARYVYTRRSPETAAERDRLRAEVEQMKTDPLHITTSAERLESRIRKAFTDGLNECRRQYKPQIEALEKQVEALRAEKAELVAALELVQPHAVASPTASQVIRAALDKATATEGGG